MNKNEIGKNNESEADKLHTLDFVGTDGERYSIEALDNQGTYVITLEAGVVKGQWKITDGEYKLTSENKSVFPPKAIEKIKTYLDSLLPSGMTQNTEYTKKDISDTLSK